jgi:hypothetical protein
LTKTSPGAFSSTFWITPQLAALALQKAVSIAVMPLRVRMRAANVAKESPPLNMGTLNVYERTVQSAAACVSKPSSSTKRLSSVLLTIVAKSCLYWLPSLPPHVLRQRILSFLHTTLSSAQAFTWKPKLCAARPTSVKISYLNRRQISYRKCDEVRSTVPSGSMSYSSGVSTTRPLSAASARMLRHDW